MLLDSISCFPSRKTYSGQLKKSNEARAKSEVAIITPMARATVGLAFSFL
jgi:hypothetical protein